jgi:two-component system sensor kinase FixL
MVRGQVEFDADHKPLRMRGVLSEITARRQAEETLRLVVETSPTALLIVNTQGLITLVNRQAETVFAYSRDELVGMSVDRLVPHRYHGRHVDERARYTAHPSVRQIGTGGDLFALRKDGSEVPIEVALSPIHGDTGLSILVSVTDITERKRTERELAVRRDELAHLSRVVLLAELSGSLAHELNQPLTAILSNAQAGVRFLAHSPPNLDEVRDSLVNIVENDKRAGEVIRRLRAMLRKDRADHRHLDINDVVLDVLRIIRSDLLNRKVDIKLELMPNLPAIEGDRVQLQQVLLNLMMNATDAMGSVAHARVLTVCTLLAEDGEVEVQVADNGPGIPEQDLARIFAPFVTGKNGGMGLGLSVCSMLVQAHAGMLWATNNSGGGATLHFRLPRYSDIPSTNRD